MQGGSQGYVRTWTAVDSSVILYGIGGNRWVPQLAVSTANMHPEKHQRPAPI